MTDVTIENEQKLLSVWGNKTRSEFERNVYKSTKCGAFVVWGENDVSIGSIVEGADAEVYPILLVYPFTEDELNSTLEDIDRLAHEIWREWNDNDC